MRRIKRTDELDDGEVDELECMKKLKILPGLTKKWRIKQTDELYDDEFYCTL